MNGVFRVTRRGVARTGVCGLAALGGLGLMVLAQPASGQFGESVSDGPIDAEPVCLEDAPNGWACDGSTASSEEGCPEISIIQSDECLTVTQAASGTTSSQAYSAVCKIRFWSRNAEGECVSDVFTVNRRCKSAVGAGCGGGVGHQ